jgi:ABC-2 type transport system permease protein
LDLVWQRYNPYPKLNIQGIPDEWLFIREEPGEEQGLINPEHMITSGLDELFLPFATAVEPDPSSELKFTKLVTTRDLSGTINYDQYVQFQRDPAMLKAFRRQRGHLTLAALIQGGVPETAGASAPVAAAQPDNATDDPETAGADSADPDDSSPAAGEEPVPAADSESTPSIHVVYVSDIDLMFSAFLRIRARPDEQEDIQWQFENVTFLLNIVDYLSGDTDYIPIRKRKPHYSTLKVMEARVDEAREHEFLQAAEFQRKFDDAVAEAERANEETLKKFQDIVDELQKKQREGEEINQVELREKMTRLREQQQVLQRRLDIQKQRFERERERAVERIRRDVDLEIQRTQFVYKFWAVAVPWIPPFLVGVVVFVRRRLREREGIEKSRLR